MFVWLDFIPSQRDIEIEVRRMEGYYSGIENGR